MRTAALALLAIALGLAEAAAGAPPVERGDSEGTERLVAALDGALVAALALPEQGALLALVRAPAEPDGPRRLVRLELGGEGRLANLLDGVGGWTKSLHAVDLGAGLELLAGGLGRIESLGALAAPRAPGRALLVHPGVDLRSLAPGRLRVGPETSLAAAEAGALRLYAPDGAGGLALAAARALPFEVERTATGLRLRGARVVRLPGGAGTTRFAVGPEPAGAARLRAWVLEARDGDWRELEAWAALPGPERVEESWMIDVDGEPVLVVRAQGAAVLSVLERQRWRVWPLGADRTRAGRAPALAFEADSKRWHEGAVAAGDLDGDGRDDLILARPEGLSGADLVVEVRRGLGDGRFESRARRDDLDGAGGAWRLAAGERDRPPALAVRRSDRLELRGFAARGGALSRAPLLAASSPDAAGGFEWLGVAWLEGAPLALASAAGESGEESLVVLRPRR